MSNFQWSLFYQSSIYIMRKVTFLLVFTGMVSVFDAFPLAKRMVDMTYTFDETTLHFPTTKEFEKRTFNFNRSSLDEDIWIQSDEYSSNVHVGTHMDAPAHFARGGKTIEQLDFSHFVAPAAVVDISSKGELDPDAVATVEDLLQWESTTGQSLDETILLLRTGWGRKWGDRTAYFGTPENDPAKLHFPGLSGEAAQWLVDNRNIYGIGIDTLSFDKGSERGYVAHRILLGKGIFGLENVARMDEIPIYGAKLSVMPMKIGGASGAPTRIIATFPQVVFERQMAKK